MGDNTVRLPQKKSWLSALSCWEYPPYLSASVKGYIGPQRFISVGALGLWTRTYLTMAVNLSILCYLESKCAYPLIEFMGVPCLPPHVQVNNIVCTGTR